MKLFISFLVVTQLSGTINITSFFKRDKTIRTGLPAKEKKLRKLGCHKLGLINQRGVIMKNCCRK